MANTRERLLQLFRQKSASKQEVIQSTQYVVTDKDALSVVNEHGIINPSQSVTSSEGVKPRKYNVTPSDLAKQGRNEILHVRPTRDVTLGSEEDVK